MKFRSGDFYDGQYYLVSSRCAECGRARKSILNECQGGRILICPDCGSHSGNSVQTEIDIGLGTCYFAERVCRCYGRIATNGKISWCVDCFEVPNEV